VSRWTYVSQNTQSPGLRFRALLTEGDIKVYIDRENPASLSEPIGR
jgi:hypothetical protein